MTSRYLTSVERRLQNLEQLIAERLPGVNIEEALASPRVPTPPSEFQQSPSVTGDAPGDGRAEAESEAVPSEADGYDWKEEVASVSGLADGMAALTIDPTGSGYLGEPWLKTARCPSINHHVRIDRWSVLPALAAVLAW